MRYHPILIPLSKNTDEYDYLKYIIIIRCILYYVLVLHLTMLKPLLGIYPVYLQYVDDITIINQKRNAVIIIVLFVFL